MGRSGVQYRDRLRELEGASSLTNVRGPRSISVKDAVEPLLHASWLPEVDRLVIATFIERQRGRERLGVWEPALGGRRRPTEGLDGNAQPKGGFQGR